MTFPSTARGLALSALVLLVCQGCAPPDPPPTPQPRSLEAAKLALASGDYPGLRRALGHQEGYVESARPLADQLDPDGWLVCMGGVSREVRLGAAVKAMQAGDRHALLDALGFNEQQLRADILNAGDSVEARRADGMNYFDQAPHALSILEHAELPARPELALAMHVTLHGVRDGHRFRVDYALREDAVVSLRARRELAAPDVSRPSGARELDPRTFHLRSPWRGLDLSGLSDRRWTAALVQCLLDDGRMLKLRMARDGKGWFIAEHSDRSLVRRLEDARDDALAAILRGAQSFEHSRRRWPWGPHELSEPAGRYVDPAAPEGRRGWARHDDNPARTLELADDPAVQGWAVRSKHRTEKGFRAITRDGQLTWLD